MYSFQSYSVRPAPAMILFFSLISVLLGPLTSLAAAPMQKKQSGYLHIMVGKFEVSAISDGTVALPVEKLLSEPEKLTKSALQKSFIGLPAETSVNA